MMAEILLQSESLQAVQEAVKSEIVYLNYMIGALCFLISGFGGILWHYFKGEKENMKDAITSLNEAVGELKESNTVQSKMIKIIARKTGVEIGE